MTHLDAMRAVLRRVDPGLAFFDVRTLQHRLDDQTSSGRFLVRLMTAFAAIGLLLAAIGIYGVTSYGISRRAREIGVRLALGATRGRVVADVIRSGLGPVAWGLAAGIGGVWGLHRFVRGLLYGVEPFDPTTLSVTVATLLLVAAFANWLPARRATRNEPVRVLRAD
jgi:ABC-type antimicrobial peptide transport system permease subunit